MKILVTGGAGFIGSHVADALLAAGHLVCIIDDLSTGRMENLNPHAEFHRIDIRSEAIADLFHKNKFDALVHHAAQMDVRRSVEDPLFDASVNVLGTLNLLQQCIATGVRTFIFASTGGAIYGEQDTFPADERHPCRPLSPYGVSKLTVESYLRFYGAIYGLRTVALRYANVYGPRQNPHGEAGVVAIFTSRMLGGEQPLINGDGTQTRDYTYVGDVVRANLAALGYSSSGTFNVGTGIETSVNDIFRNLASLTGAACTERHGPAKKGEQQRSVLSYRHIQEVLGWTPTVELREGLRRTVEYFRAAMGA